MAARKTSERTLVAAIEMDSFKDDEAGSNRQYLLSILKGVLRQGCDRIVMVGLVSRLPQPIVDFLQIAVEVGTEVHLQRLPPEEVDGDDYIWISGTSPQIA